MRTFSSWVRCGPSPVSTLIARATGPWSTTQPMYDRRAASSIAPSASIGRTVAGMRPFRSSVMAGSVGRGKAGAVTVYYRTPAGRDRAGRRRAPRGPRPPMSALRDNRSNRRRSTMGGLDDFSLDGLVAVIPGGAGGIGSALAVAFAEAGAKVVVAGRTQEIARRDDRQGARRRQRGPRRRRRRDRRSRQRAHRPRDGREVRPHRHHGQRGRWRRRQGAPQRRDLSRVPTGTGSWTSTCAARSSRPRPPSAR